MNRITRTLGALVALVPLFFVAAPAVAIVATAPACSSLGEPRGMIRTDAVRETVGYVVTRYLHYVEADEGLEEPARVILFEDGAVLVELVEPEGASISAVAISPLIRRVGGHHDKYVLLDPALTPLQREVYLESTGRLYALLEAAGIKE